MNPVLAIDIGGTKIAIAAVSEGGTIIASKSFPTEPLSGFASGLQRICAGISEIQDQSGTCQFSAAGIACAGPLDSVSGIIHNPFTLPTWEGCDIISPLRDFCKAPVFLDNDAAAAALGECWLGQGAKRDPVLMLTFGTGIGGAIVAGGRVHRGMRGQHPEIGHIKISSQGPECYCGTNGCFESLASGSALDRAAVQMGLSSAADLFSEALAGNKAAELAVDILGEVIARATFTLAHALLPEMIIFGGGLMDAQFEALVGPSRAILTGAPMLASQGVAIERAKLGNTAGLIGAARLAYQSI